MNRKEHWEKIYTTKQPSEVSWTQEVPETSLRLIAELNLNKDIAIIDIGGGDGNLVDHLLDLGYTDLSVLDISEAAINRAKKRLGERADKVKWFVSDILEFKPTRVYDVWHDRAVFHFLTSKEETTHYKDMVELYARNIVLGTFATDGPIKCSGLEITQYDKAKIIDFFSPKFELHTCQNQNHITPFDTIQKFVFAVLKSVS